MITQVIVNGQNANLYIPDNFVGDVAVLYCHGASGNHTEPASNLLTPALLSKGWMVAAAALNGNNWGNAASQTTLRALHDYIVANHGISKTVLLGQSMGGLVSLSVLAAGVLSTVKGWAGVVPVCNLADMFRSNSNPPYSAQIRAAYGIASDGSDYASKTSGFDPVLLNGFAFTGRRMRFYASNADTVVPRAAHSNTMSALVAPYAVESVVVSHTGNHSDTSAYQPADLVPFFERCLTSTTQLLEFNCTTGLSLSAKLFAIGSDTVVQTALNVVEKPNNKNRYVATFVDVPAGAYQLNAFVGPVGGFANELYELTAASHFFLPLSEKSFSQEIQSLSGQISSINTDIAGDVVTALSAVEPRIVSQYDPRKRHLALVQSDDYNYTSRTHVDMAINLPAGVNANACTVRFSAVHQESPSARLDLTLSLASMAGKHFVRFQATAVQMSILNGMYDWQAVVVETANSRRVTVISGTLDVAKATVALS